jgi:hypothetical protein
MGRVDMTGMLYPVEQATPVVVADLAATRLFTLRLSVLIVGFPGSGRTMPYETSVFEQVFVNDVSAQVCAGSGCGLLRAPRPLF